jgi:hypothetical protein
MITRLQNVSEPCSIVVSEEAHRSITTAPVKSRNHQSNMHTIISNISQEELTPLKETPTRVHTGGDIISPNAADNLSQSKRRVVFKKALIKEEAHKQQLY